MRAFRQPGALALCGSNNAGLCIHPGLVLGWLPSIRVTPSCLPWKERLRVAMSFGSRSIKRWRRGGSSLSFSFICAPARSPIPSQRLAPRAPGKPRANVRPALEPQHHRPLSPILSTLLHPPKPKAVRYVMLRRTIEKCLDRINPLAKNTTAIASGGRVRMWDPRQFRLRYFLAVFWPRQLSRPPFATSFTYTAGFPAKGFVQMRWSAC